MRQYEKYNAVETLWNLKFPAHWDVFPLCSMAKEKSICNCTDMELLSVYLDAGVVPFSKRTEKRTNTTSKDLSKYQRVDVGDFVLNNQQAWRGSVGVSKYTGITSPAYIILSLNDQLTLDYANYLFRSRIMVDQYLIVSKGVGSIQRNLYWQELKRASVLVPPKDEQDQIVRYLDWKVSNINHLIHGYQRQIDLLEERKRSFTFNAVTQGLQGDVVKTESPLYWLESVPAHWDTNSIAQLFTEVKNKNKGMQENNLLSLSYGAIKRRNINATEGLLPASFEGYNIIEKDDIVLRLTDLQNDHKSLRTGIATERGIITSAYLTIRNKSDNNPEFLQLFLHAFDLAKGFYNVGASGVRQSLNWDTVKMLKVLTPPVPEQNQIVEAIKAEYSKIETAINSVKKQIELLREYRTRLISDVVTGQVDVRGVEIPDYTPEEDNVVDDENNDTEEVTENAD